MKCVHPPDHVVTKYDTTGIPEPYELEYRECLDCGEWLPIGPSNDSNVVEIRAAEIAADAADGVGPGGHRPDHCTGEHCWHWYEEFEDDAGPCCYCGYDGPVLPDVNNECQAGHLAHAIVTHGATP